MKILERWYYDNLSHKKSVIPVHLECHNGLYRLEMERKLSVLNKDIYYRIPLFETLNILEIEDIKNKLLVYNAAIKDFINRAEMKKVINEENIKITYGLWHPPYGNKSFRVELYNTDLNEDIGERWIMPSPFLTYLLLNHMTMRGASFVGEDYRKQGYGKKMYDITDELTSWDIIPDGYCCAPGYLTPDGQKYWDKRLLYKSIPSFSDSELLKRLDTMNKLYNGIYTRFGVNQQNVIALAYHMDKPVYVTSNGFIALTPYTYPYEETQKITVENYIQKNNIKIDDTQNTLILNLIEELKTEHANTYQY